MIIMTFIPHRDTVSVARLADLAAPIQLKVNQVDSDNNHNWSLMSSWYSWGMIITNHQWYWTPTRKKLLEVDADDLSWQMESVAGTSWTICINAPVSSWPAIKIIWIVCIKRLLCQFNISISSNISFSLYFCTLLPEGRRGSAGIQPWCPSEPRRPLLSPCCAKVESICHLDIDIFTWIWKGSMRRSPMHRCLHSALLCQSTLGGRGTLLGKKGCFYHQQSTK